MQLVTRNAVLRILLTAMGAPSASLLAQGAVHHPIPDSVSRPLAPRYSVPVNGLGQAPLGIARGARLVGTVGGTATQDVSHTLGAIADAAIDERGRVYVIDSELGDFRVFASDGRLLQRLASTGTAPRMKDLRAVALGPSGRVLVAARDKTIHVFARQADTLSYERSFSVEATPVDMCWTGSVLAIATQTDGPHAVLVYRLTGAAGASFGHFYSTPDRLVRWGYSKAAIACDTERQQVLVAPMMGQDVRAYSVSGSPRWVTKVLGFRSPAVTSWPDGSSEVTLPQGGFNMVSGIRVLPTGDALYQVTLVATPRTRGGERQTLGVRSAVLGHRDGQPELLAASTPRILDINSRYFAALNDTGANPTIQIWQLSITR